ncbi:MAG: CvpA family protein [Candidatus Limivicinus sp.]|jgi:hypothetical protein
MNAVIDIVLLIIIALCTWNGYKRGFIGGIAGILAVVVALFGGSLLSSAYSHELVPALEPFVSGYVDSQKNREEILEDMGYGDSEKSLNDILTEDASLKSDYAYECLTSAGFYSKTADKLAADAVELENESEMDMTEAVVAVICDTVSYVAGTALVFLMILILLIAIGSIGNLSMRLPNMEGLDEIGGSILGFVKGFIYCILLCWLLSFMGIVIGRDTMSKTTLARFFLAFRFITNALM